MNNPETTISSKAPIIGELLVTDHILGMWLIAL